MLKSLYLALAPPRLTPIAPRRLVPGAPAPPPARAVTVATWNIAWGQGQGSELSGSAPMRTPAERANALARMGAWLAREKIDIALLQEVDLGAARSENLDQATILGEQAGMMWAAAAPSWDLPYLPYPKGRHAGRLRSGGAILSRFPIRSAWIETMPKPIAKPAWYRAFAPARYLLQAEIDLGEGRIIQAATAHLEAFDAPNRRLQAGIVSSRLSALLEKPYLVFGGDLNTVPPGAKIAHGYPDEPDADHRHDPTYRIIHDTAGLTAVIPPETIGRDPDAYHTFPAHQPCRMLDHMFIGPGARVAYARVGIEAGDASDHLPVMARLALDFDA